MKLRLVDTIQKPSLITPWSLVHVLVGGLIYLYLKFFFKNISITTAFIVMIVIHTLYEIKDLFSYFKITKKTQWNDNSLTNSIGDTLCAIIGFFIATQVHEVNVPLLLVFTLIYISSAILLFIYKLD